MKSSFPSYTYCFIFAISTLSRTSVSVPLVFSVAEEAPVGTQVANISQHAASPVAAERRYRIRPSSPYFDLDLSTGVLRTAEVLDREELCPYEPFCELVIDVIATTGTCSEYSYLLVGLVVRHRCRSRSGSRRSDIHTYVHTNKFI